MEGEAGIEVGGQVEGEADEAYGDATGAEAAEMGAVGAMGAADALDVGSPGAGAGAGAGAEAEAAQEAAAAGVEAELLSAPRVAHALAVTPRIVSFHATPIYTRRRRDGGSARGGARLCAAPRGAHQG